MYALSYEQFAKRLYVNNEQIYNYFFQDSFCASGLYYGLVADTMYVGQHKPVALHATICLKK